MEHRGIEYTVVQTINPSGWKWSFERDGRSPRSGIAFNRAEAINAARRAISQLLRDQQHQ
jgi:YD repeat-containing protein